MIAVGIVSWWGHIGCLRQEPAGFAALTLRLGGFGGRVYQGSEEMGMERLWAPWRLSYVASAKPPADADPCFLCRGLAGPNDRENLIVLRQEHSIVVLNRFPYNNGHLLVAPRSHKAKLADLTS